MPVLKYFDPVTDTWKVLTSGNGSGGGSGSGVAVQPDAPADPASGDLWLDTDGDVGAGDVAGTLKWYNPDTTQWETVNGGGGGGSGTDIPVQPEPPSTPEDGDLWFDTDEASITGEGPSWTQVLDEPGTSLANWTTVSGTWVTNASGYIEQTATAGSYHGLRYTGPGAAIFQGGPLVVEAEIYMDTTGAAALHRAMIAPGARAVLSGEDPWMGLTRGSAGFGHVMQRGTTAADVIPDAAVTENAWHVVRQTRTGTTIGQSLNGTFAAVGTVSITGPLTTSAHNLMLISYAGPVRYRNIKAWRFNGPGV